ncbi:trehalose-phosphatase [Paracoccidioides lutzii Pb01]|uniref:Trehalose-phosphatase n=1 Tax=Paracoccidioides lutzii (strain ATCC MYA-826 / Pb01) TaxID=502779 RepID=C1H7G2_PARBA|nr:trehalose-phosphatase [Paracoccidioides lutzii Pb01]EEH35656.1 trehalose-phosphatase [Paracoccidioides lutzii Pb01]
MTVFVVSLFLPYTVNFQLPEGLQTRRPSSPRHRHVREGSSELHRKQFSSLFSQRRKPTSPTIPAFPKEQVQHHSLTSDKSSKPKPKVDQSGYPFPSPADLQPLAPSDPHSPTWGTKGVFNQPKAMPLCSPAPSILDHGVATDSKNAADAIKLFTLTQPDPENDYFAGAAWTIVPSEQGNGGLRNAVRSTVDSNVLGSVFWVGTLGMPTDALDDHTKDNIAEKLEVDYDALTVYVDDSDFDGHYLHFCKTILWPVFHYQIPDNPKSKAYEDHSWVYYVRVNQAFADRIVRNWKRDDVIWFHDYHLLLVPAMVRKQLPDAQIGFFLHIAFPSSEVFRCLSVREELLKGMLGANLIGFQAQEYCHHFLQTCSRILTVEATNEGVQLDDRFVNVGTFPIGIDVKGLDGIRSNDEVAQWMRIIKEKYEGKRLVVARDKLDNIRGVRQKLLTYELFLRKYPQWQDKVVLIQVALPTTEQSELDATVSDIVTRVNSANFSLAHQPLVFLKQDIDFPQYIALISMADVLMVTSLREGMNLTSHEFIQCQNGQYSEKKHGSLILSEFTGSASLFEGHSLLVNPWNYKQCAEALNTALEMNPEQKQRSWTKLNDIIMKHTTANWFKTFIEALRKAWSEQSFRDNVSIPRLSVNDLCSKYKRSSHRLFILDYEGTLASWGSPTSIVLTTPKRAIDTLNDLIEDPKNIVYVMSSRMPEEMERLFRRVAGLGLIAENGRYLREANHEDWVRLVSEEHTETWKEGVADMIRYFQERTEGSWVEHMHTSLVFHFANAEDPQTAERHASECANHINDTCANHNVHAIVDKDALIVEPVSPNKATAASTVLECLQRSAKGSLPATNQEPDFLFVVGDGREDEVIFRWANKLDEEGVIKNVLTVTLGSKNTEAKATLTQGVTGVLSCLQKLATISQVTQ